MPVFALAINETPKCFNINGVAFAKRQMRELFPNWGDTQQTFYRFLVIAPYLADRKNPEETGKPAGKYAVLKARRIMKELKLPDVAIVPFMMACAQIGQITPENFGALADEIHDATCDCGVSKTPRNFQADNVVDMRSFFGKPKTLH